MAAGDVNGEQSMLQEARAEVGVADHKASLVLAALGIGFGALLGGILAGDWSPRQLDVTAGILWWTGAGGALLSVASAGAAVWPRYRRVEVAEGIFFWGHIATFESLEECVQALDAQEQTDMDRTRHQLWNLSRIVHKKYVLVRLALAAAGSSGLLLLAVAVLTN